MKIAQVAPLWETVPPQTYGGTELVTHMLTEELIRQGHEVTLYACQGSSVPKSTKAHLKICCEKPLREMQLTHQDMFTFLYEARLMGKVIEDADQYDVIHNHMGFQFLPFAACTQTPVVTTLHGVFEPKSVRPFVELYKHLPFVSISDYQRKPCPDLNYVATIHHGLDLDTMDPSYSMENDYLAFLGRFSPEKGPHHAIRIAKETGEKLIMSGKVDIVDQDYFEQEIKPLVDGVQIIFIGEVNLEQKVQLLRNAKATLCPVTWPEPFGLVLTESMACGTPVLALRDGSIPEVVVHGKTGFVADNLAELTTYVARISELSRQACRTLVETRFSVERMTNDYVKTYRSLLSTPTSQKNDNIVFLKDTDKIRVLPKEC